MNYLSVLTSTREERKTKVYDKTKELVIRKGKRKAREKSGSMAQAVRPRRMRSRRQRHILYVCMRIILYIYV